MVADLKCFPLLCKTRINDRLAITGKMEVNSCALCKIREEDIITHILAECPQVKSSLKWDNWIKDLRAISARRQGLLTMIINGNRLDILEEMEDRVRIWVNKRIKVEKGLTDL
jgi:hypothetical protein